MTTGTTPFALPRGIDLRARPLRPDDAEAVVALARADEAESLPEAMTELVDVQRSWRAPDADLGRRSLGLLDGDDLVAYVVVGRHGRLDAVVPARLRGRGIGTALYRWARATAAALGEREVAQTVPVGSAAEASLSRPGRTRTSTRGCWSCPPSVGWSPNRSPTATISARGGPTR